MDPLDLTPNYEDLSESEKRYIHIIKAVKSLKEKPRMCLTRNCSHVAIANGVYCIFCYRVVVTDIGA
jgi:hypothetical protein